ncbi:helix-turn-helix transcriptional regulator [Chengkuizengella axinellae]|uniref:Helix-turn-helix transcriptional regulator n=1 Tax=Chengkuizengella axinellae TaxID=3064388 RepID=A0ABT9J3I9_9BACL|nr:helix-turn-helix transcriptional regulator [Chengkuizengella sp. 2205SS18-9]MDP5276002.1 helix-turn-helix transcriptional regulator [Chengkuizengella sp. 2205SS18-9]
MSSNHDMPSLGVLKLQESRKNYHLSRYTPSEDVGFFVKHFWRVSWDLLDKEPFMQEVIPNPCVNLVIEQNKTGIFGPAKNKFSYLVEGKGQVFGVKFKPGGFYPFLKKAVSDLSNRPLDVKSVFNIDSQTFEKSILSHNNEHAMVEYVEKIIRAKLPEENKNVTFINEIIDYICENQEVTKVDQVCDYHHINKRKLQRIFQQYVGVSPKWVIKLYRLQNAAEMIDQNVTHNWLDLSINLGYYDQSHFIKDFKTITGKTPDEYAF